MSTFHVGLLYGLLNVQRGGGPSVWETCLALCRRLPNDGDVIGVVASGSYLDLRLRNAVGASRLFLHAAAHGDLDQFKASVDGEPVIVLGGSDYNVPEPFSVWPATVPAHTHRIRSIDSLYSGSHCPILIIVEFSQTVDEILAGASSTIGRHRPSILFDFSSILLENRLAVWSRCISFLGEFGYDWYDGLLLPCSAAERQEQLVFEQGATIFCAVPKSPAKEGEHHSGDADLASIFWLLQSRDWCPEVLFDSTRDGPLRLHCDDRILAFGLHPSETDGSGLQWRWTGPDVHVRFALPIPSGGAWYVKFDVFSWGGGIDRSPLKVFYAGHLLRVELVTEYVVRIGPIAVQPSINGPVYLDMVTPPTRRASSDDPRMIGVSFSSITLERDSPRPALL